MLQHETTATHSASRQAGKDAPCAEGAVVAKPLPRKAPAVVRVRLTHEQMTYAAQIGARRHIEALARNLPDRHGYDGADGWTVHIEGACGELVVAIALNRTWEATVNTFKVGGDVGHLQVRTRSKHGYELLVRDGDRDEDIFVLVTGQAPNYRIVGWIRGVDAKRPEWQQTHGNRPPAYFVPHRALRAFPDRRGAGEPAPPIPSGYAYTEAVST